MSPRFSPGSLGKDEVSSAGGWSPCWLHALSPGSQYRKQMNWKSIMRFLCLTKSHRPQLGQVPGVKSSLEKWPRVWTQWKRIQATHFQDMPNQDRRLCTGLVWFLRNLSNSDYRQRTWTDRELEYAVFFSSTLQMSLLYCEMCHSGNHCPPGL